MSIGLNDGNSLGNIGSINGNDAGTVLGDVGTNGKSNILTDAVTSLGKTTKGIGDFFNNLFKNGLKGGAEYLWTGDPNYAENKEKAAREAEEKQKQEDLEKYKREYEAMALAGLNPYSMFSGGNMIADGKKEKENDNEKLMMLMLLGLTKML